VLGRRQKQKTLDIAPLSGATYHRSAQVWHALSRDHAVLPATHAFIHGRNEPYLPSVTVMIGVRVKATVSDRVEKVGLGNYLICKSETSEQLQTVLSS